MATRGPLHLYLNLKFYKFLSIPMFSSQYISTVAMVVLHKLIDSISVHSFLPPQNVKNQSVNPIYVALRATNKIGGNSIAS